MLFYDIFVIRGVVAQAVANLELILLRLIKIIFLDILEQFVHKLSQKWSPKGVIFAKKKA